MTGIGRDLSELVATPPPRPERTHVVAQLVGIDGKRALVSVDGSTPIRLPYLPGVYDGITTVVCLCNPTDGGRAVYVLGPVGTQEAPPPTPVPPSTVAASATILPTSTGSWRAVRGAWDRWTGGDGAPTDLYQGDGYGSGPMVGLATYGDQIVGLGATEITSISVMLVRVSTGTTGPVTLVVQGSPHGVRPGGAPSGSGETAQVVLARGGDSIRLALPASVCEAMRTGAVKGLVLVGGTYAGVKGVTRADGMALSVTYRRPA